jgi:Na+-driven multidrug efflux pump
LHPSPCPSRNAFIEQYRDSIDFARENIPRLFLRLFVPTILGLLFGAMLNIADGIFVGQGVGSGDTVRIRKTFRLSLTLAFVLGLLMTLCGLFFTGPLVSLFLKPGTAAWTICENGLPLFSLSYVFFTMNVVVVGYLQSMERSRAATFFMLLRSCILLVPSFLVLPILVGNAGLSLSVPVSEAITLVVMLMVLGLKSLRTLEKV